MGGRVEGRRRDMMARDGMEYCFWNLSLNRKRRIRWLGDLLHCIRLSSFSLSFSDFFLCYNS